VSAGLAHAQKCHADLNQPSGAPLLAARPFRIKLLNPISKYGDIVWVSVNTEGQPDGIGFSVGEGFSNEHVVPVASGENSAAAFINSQCPDGYTFGPSAARPHQPPSPKAGNAGIRFGQASNGITVGDFNGDGVLDYAEVDNASINVTLYNAAGTALSENSYPLPSTSETGLVAWDFNGDGHLDLAVLQDPIGSAANGTVALLLGNGDGTFGAATTIATGVPSGSLALADFNGDGKPDLFVYGGLQSVVLLSQGNGSFSAPVLSGIGPGGVASAVAVDLNGDGKVDVMLTTGDDVYVYTGNGNGTFNAPIQSPTGGLPGAFIYLGYADFNGDGKIDYLIANGVDSALYLAFGNGDGTFKAPQVYAAPANVGPVGIIPLEDGNTAMVMGDSFSDSLEFFFASPAGQIGLPSVQTLAVAEGEYQPAVLTADLNGDKKPDLVVTVATGVLVELGNGDGTFASPVAYATNGIPVATAIVDLNGDGKPDLVTTNPTGANVFLNNGDGTFRAGAGLTGNPWTRLAVADFNGDGKPDVAVVDSQTTYSGATSSTVEILLSNGEGTFAAPLSTTVPGPNEGGFLTGDFNGDGKTDLVLSYTMDGFTPIVAFYPGKGDGTFGTPSVLPVVAFTLGAGDLNRDGKLDLVTANYQTATLDVLLGNGDGTFQAPVTISNSDVSSITTADLNGDGNPDLILGDCCGYTEASYMLGNGDGTFGAQTYFLSGPNPNSIVVGDFDGSGHASLAIAGQYGYGADTPTLTLIKTSFPLVAAVVSSAYPQAQGLAPGMLATAYGTDLASSTPGATTLPLPTTDAGTSISINDSAGSTTAAPLLYVSPGQVNFEVPAGVALGAAEVDVTSGDGTISSETVQVGSVAPGVFALDAAGLAAADLLTVSGATQTYSNVFTVSSSGTLAPVPISLGGSGSQVYLILFGTGFQGAGTAGVTVTIGGVNATVAYAGEQGSFAGLDQANVLIPPSLAGKGQVTIQLTANGIAANPVNVTIQ
jgi:uncharacterized protein (TIGR03437 family)